jgi:hypothetical protein
MTPIEHLQQRAKNLHLYGLIAHWYELADCAWVEFALSYGAAKLQPPGRSRTASLTKG